MKITINNEEVLCDKDFTINEEMLNTSSTILNNVYPATWEQDKDYTSRFYYPKDYSKCKIFDEIVHPTTREDVEGTSFSINVDTSKEYQVQTLKGQTTQTGTPTPSSPQSINVVSGKQVVSVCGKNLFDKNNLQELKGYFSASQTTIASNAVNYTFYISCQPNTTYTITITSGTGTFNFGYTETLPAINTQVYGITTTKTLTTGANGHYLVCRYYHSNNATKTKQQILDSIQIEKSNQATTYEEYKGNDYEINLGKNLAQLTDYTRTSGGLTAIISNTGSMTIQSGTSTSTAFLATNDYMYIPKGTYTLSANNSVALDNVNDFLRLVDSSGSEIAGTKAQLNVINGKITFTLNQDYYNARLQIRINSGTTFSEDYVIYPQLEKGSVASSFSPYKTPIYLGNIGTYQDYIFRNTTENPLYDSNLEEGQWYIHKEIGRVVLNGSETTINTASNNRFRVYLTTDYAKASSNTINVMSDKLIGVSQATTASTTQDFVISANNDSFFIRNTTTTSVANFRTWLSTNTPIVYYILNTPTNTLIEDEELINQLNSIELLEGLNNVSVSSANLPALLNLHYNFNDDIEIVDEKEIIYTGYVNNYTLPKMKNKLEYRELDIDLLSPLALATLRTADAIGTYNLQDLVKEIIQPLIDDGFTLKELNVGNNQITVNYLTETVESSLNKLSNKFNFWWYIDKNKNIYINDINYIFNKNKVLTYDDDNKINGLIDFTPSLESINYFNTIDFTNVRLITKSHYQKDQTTVSGMTNVDYLYFNPLVSKDYINPGEEIEFDIPFIINTDKRGYTNTGSNVEQGYFRLYKIIANSTIDEVVSLRPDVNNQVIVPNNAIISDNYSDEKEFVFVRDSFFKNLIVGMKYNGSSKINIGLIVSDTALMWAKVRINDNAEVSVNKNIISTSGIIEKQIDMNEQWVTYEELLEVSNSLIGKNNVNVEKLNLVMDVENNLNIGDIITVNKSNFLTQGDFVITDKKRSHYNNIDEWTFTLNNTNILESYIDLFRASEQEEQEGKTFTLITGDYSKEGFSEKYEVVVQ